MYSHWSLFVAPALFLTDFCDLIGGLTWSSSCACSGRQQWFFRFVYDWWVACVDVTALPADRSEKPVWREELDRRERSGKSPRSSELHRVGPTHRILKLDRFYIFFRGRNAHFGLHETSNDSLPIWTCGFLRISSKPPELSEKNWLRVKVWPWVSVRLKNVIKPTVSTLVDWYFSSTHGF